MHLKSLTAPVGVEPAVRLPRQPAKEACFDSAIDGAGVRVPLALPSTGIIRPGRRRRDESVRPVVRLPPHFPLEIADLLFQLQIERDIELGAALRLRELMRPCAEEIAQHHAHSYQADRRAYGVKSLLHTAPPCVTR